jgi:hypothetical protein
MEQYTHAIDYRIIRGDNTLPIIERVAMLDFEPIVKKGRDGVIISMTATPEFKSINIIIENPENAKNVIIGSLEIPFSDEGETPIQTINGIIALQLLKIQNKNISALSFDGDKKISASSSTNLSAIKSTSYANKVSNGEFQIAHRNSGYAKSAKNAPIKINSAMSELLKSTIAKNMSKFINITCRMHSDRTNCIIAGSLLVNSGEYTVCSTCRGALALCTEFKCNNSNCKSSVFIDGKGNPKNEFCNECAQNSNR